MAYGFTASSSQYLSTASAPVTALPCTLACWFKIANTSNNTTLVCLQDADGQSRIQISNNGVTTPKRAVQAVIFNSDGIFGTVGLNETSYSANTWYHGAAVFASASSIDAYFDGAVGTRNTEPDQSPSGIDQILIGARRTTSLGQYHDGLIAEVGIWNAALTAAEMASLAKGMTCDKIRPQSLVFYAPLVRNLLDQKGSIAMTNNNGATVANHPRVYA